MRALKPDRSISTRAANFAAIPLFGLALAGPVALYLLIWGEAPYEGFTQLMGLHWTLFIALVVGGVVLHELLHGVAFRLFGRVAWRTIRFGIYWPALTPFASTSTPMPARAYRLAIGFPGLMLGMVPITVALFTQAEALLWYGAFMLGAAGGDAIALFAMRDVPAGAFVVDRSDRVGCSIVE